MWDRILDGQFLSKLGGVGGIVALLSFMWTFFKKNQVITSLTSSKFERLVSSKEKRTMIKISNYIFYVIIGLIASTFLTLIYMVIDLKGYLVFVISIIGTFLYFVVLYISLTKKSVFDKRFSRSKNLNFTVSLLLLQTFCFFSVMPGFIASSASEGSLVLTTDNTGELLINITLCLLSLLFASSMFVLLIIMTLSQLREKFSKYDYECFYVLDQEYEDMKWFIYHLIDKEHFLLGNSEYIHDATIFRTEERSKILSEKIHLLKILKNKEDSIEYYI
ncbi:hypothetical protein P5G61_26855 [Paenibacillus sp. F6_3S_P_1C]|uniref:Uncharacterized protein n=1 Tax=Paenibacillus vandeheii TaxID=3035917 RepID=A0ABT8JL45_9BACL|nr:hypothetical protein [Paenibacillus vandeheii]MDN4604874.1 hypothetical protein [Paenibacillus vandeheii]